MFNNNALIAFFTGLVIFFILSLVFAIRIKTFQKNRKELVDHLKKTLQEKHNKFWKQQKCEKWFERTNKFINKKITKRKYIIYALIFLISLNLSTLIKILGDLFSRDYSNSIPSSLIFLPFLILSLFMLSALGPLFAGKHSDRTGRILDKFIYCINFIFPNIKKSLTIFTHEPLPSIYGDPRMLESFYYLKNKKNIKNLKVLYYIPPDMADENLKSISDRIMIPYKKRGLLEIFHRLNKKVDHQHFIVGDNSIVRLEKYHPPWTELHEDEYEFPNDTYLLNPILAIELKSVLKRIKGYDVSRLI